MRLIKAFLFGAVGLFIIITLFSLVIPSNVKVSRTVLINNTAPGFIYSQTAFISNWKNWYPLFKSDSTKIYVNDIPKGKKSFIVEYSNQKAEITFTSADSNAVKFTVSSEGENDIQNEIRITPVPSQSNVQVDWLAITKLKWYPWEKFYGIFIDKLTGPGYEAALDGLKTFIEEEK